MKCVIPGRCIRAFGKAIQCLSKIGDELYLEATSDGLAMKTVNPARSAYACFIFKKVFFHVYHDGRDSISAETLKCKITVKSCTSVFRALPTLEKTVDHCKLTLDLEENKLVFVFYCRHGIVKTHNLGFQECEALQAVYSKDLCPNRIVGNSKVISDVVSNFPSNLEEVTLIAEPDKARLRSYTEDDDENTRVAVSEIGIVAAEFDDYRIGIDTSVTFCLKELRAILLFTEAINHTLSLKFETAGKPVVISIDDCLEYQADFVLATLLDAHNSTLSQVHTTSTPRPGQTEAESSAAHQVATEPSFVEEEEEGPRKTRGDKGARDGDLASNVNIPFPSNPMDESSVPSPPIHSSTFNLPEPARGPAKANVPLPPVPLKDNDFEMLDEHREGHDSVPSRAHHEDSELTDALFEMENRTDAYHGGSFWGFPLRQASAQPPKIAGGRVSDTRGYGDAAGVEETAKTASVGRGQAEAARDQDTNAAEDSLLNQSGIVPGTPPAKKYKSLLFGMEMLLPNQNTSEVLAPDSDEDN